MDAALRARLAAVREAVEAAEASAAGESAAGKAMVAVVESLQVLELLVAEEAEASSCKTTELESPWEEMKDRARSVRAQVKEIVTDFWKNKAQENSREVEVLRRSSAVLNTVCIDVFIHVL
jgi:hypothetical protein